MRNNRNTEPENSRQKFSKIGYLLAVYAVEQKRHQNYQIQVEIQEIGFKIIHFSKFYKFLENFKIVIFLKIKKKLKNFKIVHFSKISNFDFELGSRFHQLHFAFHLGY